MIRVLEIADGFAARRLACLRALDPLRLARRLLLFRAAIAATGLNTRCRERRVSRVVHRGGAARARATCFRRATASRASRTRRSSRRRRRPSRSAPRSIAAPSAPDSGGHCMCSSRRSRRRSSSAVDCGDCSLAETGVSLSRSPSAPRDERNGPCGGSRDGRCEVDDRACVWALAYDRLKPYGEEDAVASRAPTIADVALRDTSAWANTFLGARSSLAPGRERRHDDRIALHHHRREHPRQPHREAGGEARRPRPRWTRESLAFRGPDGRARSLAVPEPVRLSKDGEKGRIKHVQAAILAGMQGTDADSAEGIGYLQLMAVRQVEAGAAWLDLNVDEISADDAERQQVMRWLVGVIEEVATVPLAIDSSSPDVLRAGAEAARGVAGRPMVNSASLERPEVLDLVAAAERPVVLSAAGCRRDARRHRGARRECRGDGRARAQARDRTERDLRRSARAPGRGAHRGDDGGARRGHGRCARASAPRSTSRAA